MRENFKDEFISEHVDPLHSTQEQSFDWDGLYRALGENEAETNESRERIVWALKELLAWAVTAPLHSEGAEIMIARRFIALAWVIVPKHPSLSKHAVAAIVAVAPELARYRNAAHVIHQLLTATGAE